MGVLKGKEKKKIHHRKKLQGICQIRLHKVKKRKKKREELRKRRIKKELKSIAVFKR